MSDIDQQVVRTDFTEEDVAEVVWDWVGLEGLTSVTEAMRTEIGRTFMTRAGVLRQRDAQRSLLAWMNDQDALDGAGATALWNALTEATDEVLDAHRPRLVVNQ